MKQFFEKIWNFTKQYPLIFGMLCLSIFWSLKEYIKFVNYGRFTWSSLLFLTPVIFFSLTILLLKKLLKNENNRSQTFFLSIVCVFLLGVQGNIFDDLWGSLDHYNKYQHHYIKQIFKNTYHINWKKFGTNNYLDTTNICYYKNKSGNDHALITIKHIQNTENESQKTFDVNKLKNNLKNIKISDEKPLHIPHRHVIRTIDEQYNDWIWIHDNYVYIVADIDLTTSDMYILFLQSDNSNNLTENRKIRTYIGSPSIKDCDKNGPTYKIYQYLIDNKKGENK